MAIWESLKILFGQIGSGLWLVLKTWKWSIGIIIICLMILTNTVQGMKTGEYWVSYRDGVIKHVVTADTIIYEEVNKLKENKWQIQGLKTEGFGKSIYNFWKYLTTYNFILTQLLIIWTSFYLIWLLLAGDHFFAIMAYDNFPATIWTFAIMIILYGMFNAAFTPITTETNQWQVWINILKGFLPWNTFKGMISLIINIPNIV